MTDECNVEITIRDLIEVIAQQAEELSHLRAKEAKADGERVREGQV